MALHRLFRSLTLLTIGVGSAVFGAKVYLSSPEDPELWVPFAAVSLISFVLLAAMNYNVAAQGHLLRARRARKRVTKTSMPE